MPTNQEKVPTFHRDTEIHRPEAIVKTPVTWTKAKKIEKRTRKKSNAEREAILKETLTPASEITSIKVTCTKASRIYEKPSTSHN